MCIHLKDYKVSYFAVPKCACTSLKHLFFEVENGRPWTTFLVNNQKFWVHNAYPSLPFEKAQGMTRPGFWKFAVIRDPITRLMSCYRNRLMRGRGRQQLERRAADLAALGLEPQPRFEQFVAHYETYRDLSSDIRGHSRPLSFFLGRDPAYFDRLFRLSELGDLMEDLKRRIGKLPELLHLQTRGSDVRIDPLSDATRQRIGELFEEDYKLFGAHF